MLEKRHHYWGNNWCLDACMFSRSTLTNAFFFLLSDPQKRDTPTPRPRPHYTSGSLGRTARGSYYHKAKTSRSFRARQSLSGAHNFSHAAGFHARSSSMPVRPNTGTEETDEAFLRMEAQLSNLIAEGKRALSSRIEVWDEE